MRIKFWITILGILTLTLSCTHHQAELKEPVAVLKEYISRSFSVKAESDRQNLLDLLAGDAKERLAAMTPEAFRSSMIDSKRELIKLAIKDVRFQTELGQAAIEYEISFMDPLKGNMAKVTSRKLCQLVKSDGTGAAKWLIREVQNIKEVVEFRNELSLPQ